MTTPRDSELELSGLLLVDKPAGFTSFAVVRRLGRRFDAKAGHAGTLDPNATGLLLILLGRATRLARYLVGLEKRYVTQITLGLRTTTGDSEGEELEEREVVLPAAIEALRGEVQLRVPSASAVKIAGERAYRLHRQGVAVDMPVRPSTIHELVIRRYEAPVVELELLVSSGTYVRSIADALGGHCTNLRRTAVGPFRIAEANEHRLLTPLTAVRFLPRRSLTDIEAARVCTGRSIEGRISGHVALVAENALVAVGRPSNGRIHPETVLG